MASTRRSRSPVPDSGVVTTLSSHPEVTASSVMARPVSPKDQEIIDLVRPGPDLIRTKEPMFNPTNPGKLSKIPTFFFVTLSNQKPTIHFRPPDFQSMMVTPESHVEVKPSHDSLPSEYNPPLPSGSFGSSDSHYSYHPPGCIPTPVLIAQKIAESQSGGSADTISSSLHRSSSLETENSPRYSTDHHSKQGPPTSVKPTRFPPNISVILGSKEHHGQNVGNVNIHERKAQMLANLSGTSHQLLQQEPQQVTEPQKARNIPTRSISFKDPSPDKSRMEALSKLGLNRNRAMSGGTTLLSAATVLSPPSDAEATAIPLESSHTPTTEAKHSLPTSSQLSPGYYSSQTTPHRTQEERNPTQNTSPPAVSQRSFSPPPLATKSPVLPPPEITSLEFNSYGGKSIVVHPTYSSRNETPASPTSPDPRTRQAALEQPSEFNSYGGKSKVMNTGSVTVTRNDLPDILSSHINKGQTFPAKSEPPPIEPHSYGGKSRTFNPSITSHTLSAHQQSVTVETNNYGGKSRTFNPSATLPVKPPPPTPAPRPPRHSYHGISQHKQAQPAPPMDHNKRRTNSLFRPQGITVQFGGRGASDESRKEALRKLGLLKEF